MRFIKSAVSVLLALLMVASFAACTTAETSSAASSSALESTGSVESTEDPESPSSGTENAVPPQYYSTGIDENGFYTGIIALDYVTVLDYKNMVIPKTSSEVTDAALQSEIDNRIAEFSTTEQITDRAVADGDTVNIDYVGSVDGVEFDGGSTGGSGTEVTIGVTSYIDNFLEQLIGHMPGETFDVNVTFPEDYGQDHLNGKDAVFVTTINYISEETTPELTDSFVLNNFTAEGWSSITEMKEGVSEQLRNDAINSYINDNFATITEVKSVPEELLKLHQDIYVNVQREYAEYYGMEFEQFLATYGGSADIEALLETNAESIEKGAHDILVIQAIAEKENITASDEDVATYFEENLGSADYAQYEERYGAPYLKQAVITSKVLDFLRTTVTFE